MTTEPIVEPTPRKPLRLWPGVIAAVLLTLGWFVIPKIYPDAILYGMLGGFISVVAIAVWWLLFSRARWFERVSAIALIVLALYVTSHIIHISLQNGGMGYLFFVVAVPFMSLALVGWAAATRHLSDGVRRVSLVAAILLVCAGFALLRTGGINGYADSDWHWRWSKTPEQKLLAQAEELAPLPTNPPTTTPGAGWPGFRGAARDGVVHGTKIKTDWSASPPVELWRRPIGPGWSSFAIQGELVYTQEQRGDDEVVSSYNLTTGKPVWRHQDAARFWESNAGSGPRGTPTLSNGRVYSLGATGILNALDANTGAVIWSRNAATDTSTKTPGWGFSSSPLVLDNMVIVALAGKLAAYDAATGNPRWYGESSGSGYSSPHLVTIAGVPQILLLGGPGATSVSPADGKRLWEYPLSTNTRIVQPAMTAEGDVLVHDGESNGMRRLAISNGAGGWTVTERWTSEGLNPYFGDFVVHKGYAFGVDGRGSACIDLKDGNRKWKGGTYGGGQLVLLADQDLLLVVSEKGELALVKATPDQFTELARFAAIKGKTWNHPVVVGDKVLVRNDQEMAAFRLASVDR